MANEKCSVAECEKQAKACGWCAMHYGRQYRTGSLEAPAPYLRSARTKACVDCGAAYETTGHNSKRCTSCKPAYQNAQNQKYRDKNRERLNAGARARHAANLDEHKARARARRLANPEREKEYQRRYQEKHRVKIRLKRRAYIFGIPAWLLQEMVLAQGERCAICLCSLPLDSKWCVDHCHETGTIRGILCMSCNTGLGMLRDDPILCEAAAIYLRVSY